ncbi:nucleotidyl transferase AbiEii/AbiGii toxin family protein [Bacillus cereus group sp. BfR-BA-01523]|uniref:nucleotidyl transferase AbiEii/AbiGii toxin family protein n=1 Tax=Bacillus cereus group sp. BfR-BA-01523 TaxID=2920371 RepID=UPI001F56D6D5|nr:nucleotidyl transferase AbiEii/AbiGii toxin family protein [Bacillus cereus group sp. BfR-BA-01523]
MNLHEDKEAFQELVEATASEFKLQPFQVEKDYYVSFFLKNLREVAPEIVFKGGTSLSKCYSIIDRFSEDIDITIYFEKARLTNGEITKSQKPLIEAITQTIHRLSFSFLNEGTVYPRLKFNKYEVGYTRMYEGNTQMLDHILVETTLTYKPYPCDIKDVSNYITKFLEKEQPELIKEYQLQPFPMKIQTIERTFIDKIFALCDYHHDIDYKGKSRHIYDIHMIYRSGLLNEDILPELVMHIIETRRAGHKTYSCQTGYKPVEVLKGIIKGLVFFNDYETNTREFLSVYVEYGTAIASLEEILNRGWIPHSIPDAPEPAAR